MHARPFNDLGKDKRYFLLLWKTRHIQKSHKNINNRQQNEYVEIQLAVLCLMWFFEVSWFLWKVLISWKFSIVLSQPANYLVKMQTLVKHLKQLEIRLANFTICWSVQYNNLKGVYSTLQYSSKKNHEWWDFVKFGKC